jgi:hypothetical protein
MTAPAAFQASFADFRLVKSRKVAQFVFEVPIEAADAAMAALGGFPRPDAEVWVAVARIDPKAASVAVKPASEPAKTEATAKPKLRWEDMPYSQQAAIRCEDFNFRRFLAHTDKRVGNVPLVYNAEVSACRVRELCYVDSRKNIVKGTFTGDQWASLEAEYQSWLAEQKFGEGAR